MGSILLVICLFGCWLVVSSTLDWDWSFGAFDHYPAESALGTEVVRWGLFSLGILMMLVGFGGCS